MHAEDSPLERIPDLIAKIRAMREEAEKQMDQFTDVFDYDVRRVTGVVHRASAPAERRIEDGSES